MERSLSPEHSLIKPSTRQAKDRDDARVTFLMPITF
jgi:hypothetical protein